MKKRAFIPSNDTCTPVATYSNSRMNDLCPDNFAEKTTRLMNQGDPSIQKALANKMMGGCAYNCLFDFDFPEQGGWRYNSSADYWMPKSGDEMAQLCTGISLDYILNLKANFCVTRTIRNSKCRFASYSNDRMDVLCPDSFPGKEDMYYNRTNPNAQVALANRMFSYCGSPCLYDVRDTTTGFVYSSDGTGWTWRSASDMASLCPASEFSDAADQLKLICESSGN